MGEQELIELTREAIWLTIQIALPVMIVALVVGVVIGLLQALTQIQEMTLTFVPKILAILATVFLLMPGMFLLLRNYMLQITDLIVGGGTGG
jgi:flagellar biosynthetic protein FliQ